MTNRIPLRDWLQRMDDEYLSAFIKDGGASIKFAVTADELKLDLYEAVAERCRKLDYVSVRLDVAEKAMRAHMPQDLFFGLARQIDWRLLARRLILRLAGDMGYKVEGIDPGAAGNVFAAVADLNAIDSRFFLQGIRPEIQKRVFKNRGMAKDFRVAMSQLCLMENTRDRGEYDGQPVLEWLTGANMRVSSVRPFSIYTGINRNTARYFIESALHWVRLTGYAGTVILLDNSRVTLARDPKDGKRYYTRTMTMEHYELLREFIDHIDRLSGTLLVVVTNSEFLDDTTQYRGYGIYEALLTRVMADVRDRNLVNPIASLVRLS